MPSPFAIDFRAIKPIKFNFDGQGDEDQMNAERDDARGDAGKGNAGQTFLSRVTRRRLLAVKRASEIVTVLPGPGETLHCLIVGYFDALNLLLAMLDKLAVPCRMMRLATLSFSKRNVAELAGLLDAGTVKAVSLMTSDFQKKHDGEIYAEAMLELAEKRGQKIAAARSHCKLFLMEMEDGRKYTWESSANLRTSRNFEQCCLSQDAALHDFYTNWFDALMVKHGTQATAEE